VYAQTERGFNQDQFAVKVVDLRPVVALDRSLPVRCNKRAAERMAATLPVLAALFAHIISSLYSGVAGDRRDVAERVTANLSFEAVRSELTPDQKIVVVLAERKTWTCHDGRRWRQ